MRYELVTIEFLLEKCRQEVFLMGKPDGIGGTVREGIFLGGAKNKGLV